MRPEKKQAVIEVIGGWLILLGFVLWEVLTRK